MTRCSLARNHGGLAQGGTTGQVPGLHPAGRHGVRVRGRQGEWSGAGQGVGGLRGARQTGESPAEGSPAWESPLRPEASARRRCLKFGAKGVCSQGRNPGPAPSPHAGRGPWTSAWEPPGQSAQLQGAGLQCADPYVPPTRQALRRSPPQPAAPKRGGPAGLSGSGRESGTSALCPLRLQPSPGVTGSRVRRATSSRCCSGKSMSV